MGLFSSKYKTYVGSSASRVIEDSFVPDSILAGTLRSILKDGSVTENVVTELAKGLGTKARRMYSFGRNNYIFGNPEANLHSNKVGALEVEAVLQTLHPGATINLKYSNLGAPNILHIGWFKLVRDHGYDPQTNKLGGLTASIGQDVFLHDLVVVLPAARASLYTSAATDQWGTSAKSGASPTRPSLVSSPGLSVLAQTTAVESSTTATEDHARVEYAWTTSAGVVQQGSFIISNSEYDETEDYFHVAYTADDVPMYWIYHPGDGTYEALDDLGDTSGLSQTAGTFFPFIHFRNNKQSLATDQTSVQFKDSKRMAKMLGIDYMQVHDALHENPDINDVAQAYIGLFVPITSTNELEHQYLFEFFNQLHASAQVPVPHLEESLIRTLFKGAQVEARTSIQIQDKKVKHTLSCSGISKRLVAGSLTGGAKYEAGYESTGQKHHYFRRQVSATVYSEIQVYGLEMRYWIDGKYSAVGDEVDATLLIPVDYSITRTFPLQDQEKLYARSLHLIANSSVTVKVKWYQRGAFGTFLRIVGVVLMFFDGGFTLALTNAIASGVVALISFIVVTIIVQAVISLVFKTIAKILGPEFAVLAAVAMAMYGGYKGLTQGLKTVMPEIRMLLQTALGLINGATQVIFDDLLELGKEFEAFSKESAVKMDLLEDTKKLLESSSRLNPFVIFGESPENYYNRTVHSGNVGIIGYQAIESYVDMALTLPTLSDSIGGESYV